MEGVEQLVRNQLRPYLESHVSEASGVLTMHGWCPHEHNYASALKSNILYIQAHCQTKIN